MTIMAGEGKKREILGPTLRGPTLGGLGSGEGEDFGPNRTILNDFFFGLTTVLVQADETAGHVATPWMVDEDP